MEIKKHIENLIEGIDEFEGQYVTYNSKVHREILDIISKAKNSK